MEHRWGRRLVAAMPVRLRCMRSPDSGCRCLGRIESISTSGALIKTEFGICPSTTMEVQTLTTEPGQPPRELTALIVREKPGELAVEWNDAASKAVFEVLTDVMLGCEKSEAAPALGRVSFCAMSPTRRAEKP